MKRRQSKDLDSLINAYLRLEGLETPLNEYRAVQSWPTIAGPAVARYTKNVQLRNGVMRIKLSSPALRQNLMMERTNLAQRINEHIGAQVVTEVVFC